MLGGLFYELIYEYRYNTIYIALMVACLLPAGNLGDGFTISDQSPRQTRGPSSLRC
ncbi:hypothetical protein MBT84_40560 [Streptomyces sp. MBT84]|nr:hypothetical protein [Streptomyces sp. MBT84]